MQKKIKLFDPFVSKNEEKLLLKALRSKNWASGAGSTFVNLFEQKFQEYVGAKSCVAVNSGTAALHLALSTANIAKKEVIIPSLTFVSTAHAVLYNGGKVIFADVDPNTLCIDIESVQKKINKRTAVILPVHFAGMPANLDMLRIITKENKMLLIDDAAHAAGSNLNGKKIGSLGDLTCFSFHPVKNLAMPTGGLITLNDKYFNQTKKTLLSRRWCGITDRKGVNYDVKELGWNFYMNEFAAAIGLTQLSVLEKLNKKRLQVATKYSKKLNLDRKMPLNKNCVYHFYWILVKNRNELRKKLTKIGIETGIHYKPVHKMSMYTNNVKLPVTEELSQQIVTLPTHQSLSDDDVDKIIESINKFT